MLDQIWPNWLGEQAPLEITTGFKVVRQSGGRLVSSLHLDLKGAAVEYRVGEWVQGKYGPLFYYPTLEDALSDYQAVTLDDDDLQLWEVHLIGARHVTHILNPFANAVAMYGLSFWLKHLVPSALIWDNHADVADAVKLIRRIRPQVQAG